MKKKYRLLKNQDFKSVLDNHRYVSRENATVYHKINDLQHCRVGVSVSSKIGNSVVRHKIKRQVTAMLDKCVPIECDMDLVVIIRKKYLEKTYMENYQIIEKMIYDILKRRMTNEK
jgi:ribonuclease P protein component